MSRPSKYEPVLVDWLSEHPEGTTAADLVKDIGLSTPHAYRTVRKLTKEGVLRAKGKTKTGAVIYALTSRPVQEVQVEEETSQPILPQKHLTVRSIELIDDHYRVTLELDDPKVISDLLLN